MYLVPDFEIRLLMDDLTFDEVTEIAEIKDQIKYTSNRNVTPEILAYQLKVDKVIVPSSVYNSAKETKSWNRIYSIKILGNKRR